MSEKIIVLILKVFVYSVGYLGKSIQRITPNYEEYERKCFTEIRDVTGEKL